MGRAPKDDKPAGIHQSIVVVESNLTWSWNVASLFFVSLIFIEIRACYGTGEPYDTGLWGVFKDLTRSIQQMVLWRLCFYMHTLPGVAPKLGRSESLCR